MAERSLTSVSYDENVIQELVNNTLKHARAKNIMIRVEALPEHIEIHYSDDGVGFNTGVSLEWQVLPVIHTP